MVTSPAIIKTGGDYATLSLFKAALPGTLTQLQQADIYKQAGGIDETGGGVAFSGITTTSSFKIVLNVPSSERGTGLPHSGAYVKGINGTIRATAQFFDINWLEIDATDANAALQLSSTSGGVHNVEHSLLHSLGGAVAAGTAGVDYNFRNTGIYCDGSSRVWDARGANNLEVSNCTIISLGADHNFLYDSSGNVIKNTHSAGGTSSCFLDQGSNTGSNNASSDTSATSLFSSSIASISAAAAYAGATTGAFDLRTKSGFTTFNDAGTTIAAVTDDFIGTSRPQGSAYDIGIFENITGGGGGFKPGWALGATRMISGGLFN